MFLKNDSARLITINHKAEDGTVTPYDILPGDNPAVEVPAEVAKMDFVKALLKNKSLSKATAAEAEDEEEQEEEQEEEGDDLEALRAEATGLGVKVDKRWKEPKLREEIAKAKAAQ